MSNIFKLAFEEQVEEAIIPDDPVEAALQQERLEVAIKDDSEEIQRQVDLVGSLESLRMIASLIESPTPREIALFRVSANLAVAGTNNSATDFLPAMESHQTIALEGFGEKIKETIKAIIAKMKEYWKKIKDFFVNIFTSNKKKKEKLDRDLKEFNESFLEKQNEDKKNRIEGTIVGKKSSDKEKDLDKKIKYKVNMYLLKENQLGSNVTFSQIKQNIFEFYIIKEYIDDFITDYKNLIETTYKMVGIRKIEEVRNIYNEHYNNIVKINFINHIKEGTEFISCLHFTYFKHGERDHFKFENSGGNGEAYLEASERELGKFITSFYTDILLEISKYSELYSTSALAEKTLSSYVNNLTEEDNVKEKLEFYSDLNREISTFNNIVSTYNSRLGSIISALDWLITKSDK